MLVCVCVGQYNVGKSKENMSIVIILFNSVNEVIIKEL